jgi:hypothetical protein
MDDGCHCDGHDGSAGASIESASSSSHGEHFECVDKTSGLTVTFERGFETGPNGELLRFSGNKSSLPTDQSDPAGPLV